MAAALRVALIFDGTNVDDRTFTETTTITLGSAGDATFVVAEGGDLPLPYSLLMPAGAGYTVSLAHGMTGYLTLAGKAITVEDMISRGNVQQALGARDWGIIGLDPAGRVALFFQYVTLPQPLERSGMWFDRYIGQAIAASAAVHVALLVFAFLSWEKEDSLDIDPPPTVAIAKILNESAPEPLPPEKKKGGDAPRKREEDASKRAAGKEGKIGNQDAKNVETKIPKGPRDQVAAKVSQMGLLGTLKAGKGQSNALKSLLSDSDATVTTAMAGLQGAQLVVGRGSGGMSTRGEGSGGGGTGTGQLLGVGNLAVGGGGHGARAGGGGPGRVAKELKVSMTTGAPSSEGGLSKEQVLKVVQSHAAAIQFCYEKELQRFPHLAGKVQLAWKIDSDGRVSNAKVDSSSLGNTSAEGCMSRQVKAWAFPKAPGTTDVKFPFFFKGQ